MFGADTATTPDNAGAGPTPASDLMRPLLACLVPMPTVRFGIILRAGVRVKHDLFVGRKRAQVADQFLYDAGFATIDTHCKHRGQ